MNMLPIARKKSIDWQHRLGSSMGPLKGGTLGLSCETGQLVIALGHDLGAIHCNKQESDNRIEEYQSQAGWQMVLHH